MATLDGSSGTTTGKNCYLRVVVGGMRRNYYLKGGGWEHEEDPVGSKGWAPVFGPSTISFFFWLRLPLDQAEPASGNCKIVCSLAHNPASNQGVECPSHIHPKWHGIGLGLGGQESVKLAGLISAPIQYSYYILVPSSV